MPQFEQPSGAHEVHLFVTTHWSVILSAGDSSAEVNEALQQLCQAYWYPLYAYVRRQGRSVTDAQDLTQEFFARFLERKYLRLADRNRGRFRNFLLTSLKHFLINEWTKLAREKRGGGLRVFSLDEEQAEARFNHEPAVELPPDTLYDRGWANTLLDRALSSLRAEFEKAGKLSVFDQFKPQLLTGDLAASYADLARSLDMTEGAVRVAVHRLRQRFGELLRAEVAQTVSTPAEVNEELRYLVAVIRDHHHIPRNNAGGTL